MSSWIYVPKKMSERYGTTHMIAKYGATTSLHESEINMKVGITLPVVNYRS